MDRSGTRAPPPLPAGFRLVLDPSTRRLDRGRALIGGTPLRVLRLSAAGARAIDILVSGHPVGDDPSAGRLARKLVDGGLAHPRPAGEVSGEVTVVIPVRDRSAGLAETLRCLTDGGVRVIVVDDGSGAEQARITEAAVDHARARLIRRDQPGGPAAARNAGWRAADTEFIAFLDADCQPDAGWVAALLPHFADPTVAAVAPRIVSVSAPSTPALLAAYERARSPLDLGPLEGSVRPRARVPFVPSAALLLRRDDLLALQGFDESLRVGEDVDLVWRLAERGRTVRYVPAANVSHPARATWKAWAHQRFDYGTSAATLDMRHRRSVAPLTVSGWSAAAWGLAVLGHPVAGVGVAAGTAARLPRLLGTLDHPWREGLRLAGTGHLWAGRSIADAMRRVWWPLVLLGCLCSKRARVAAVAAATVPLALEWRAARPGVGPVQWLGLRVLDDLSYGAGVWAGCLRQGRFGALAPDLTNWPGRRPMH